MTQSKGMELKSLWKTGQKQRCLQCLWCKPRPVRGFCRTWQGCSACGAGRGGWYQTPQKEFYSCQIKTCSEKIICHLGFSGLSIKLFCKEDLYTWLFGAVFFLSFLLAALKIVDWCTHVFLPSLQKFLTSLPLFLLCNCISATSFFC